jgi:hypothetical protein
VFGAKAFENAAALPLRARCQLAEGEGLVIADDGGIDAAGSGALGTNLYLLLLLAERSLIGGHELS